MLSDLQRIAGRDQKALLAAAEADQHRVLHVAARLHRRDVGVGLGIVERVQVDRGGDRPRRR